MFGVVSRAATKVTGIYGPVNGAAQLPTQPPAERPPLGQRFCHADVIFHIPIDRVGSYLYNQKGAVQAGSRGGVGGVATRNRRRRGYMMNGQSPSPTIPYTVSRSRSMFHAFDGLCFFGRTQRLFSDAEKQLVTIPHTVTFATHPFPKLALTRHGGADSSSF